MRVRIGRGGLRALGIALVAMPFAAWAANDEIAWGQMGMGLFGGLALFLFGMEMMADSLKAAAGERMKLILERLTSNRLLGAATGAALTAVIQASAVTTVLVIGFVTANLMTLSQAIGVIMGANIGTTVTAQIIAFNVTAYALPMIAIGFGMHFFSRREQTRFYGRIVMGLGLIFFGMGVMGDGMRPLRDYEPFLLLMRELSHPFYAILVAALFTALVQSSSATTGFVIVMAAQGLVPLEAGIALILGANIGTCVTALLAAIGKSRDALRAAMAHVLFNVLGVVLWLAFIPELAAIVTWLSPVAEGLEATQRLAAEVPRQIANAHTVFNVANTLLFIGFTVPLARLVVWLVPDLPEPHPTVIKPRYLDSLLLETPALALEAVRRELTRMGSRINDMLVEILPAIINGDRHTLRLVEQMDDEVDALHHFIIRYLGEISRQNLSEPQTHAIIHMMEAVNDLENVGDVVETDLVTLGNARIERGIVISEQTQRVLAEIHDLVCEALRLSIEAVTKQDRAKAVQVTLMKAPFGSLIDRAEIHEARRLVAHEPGRFAAYSLESDIIEKQKRIYYYAKRVSKAVLASEGEFQAEPPPAVR